MWTEVDTGKYKYVRNVTSNQLLAKYLILGADLRELKENIGGVMFESLLDDMIVQHEEFLAEIKSHV